MKKLNFNFCLMMGIVLIFCCNKESSDEKTQSQVKKQQIEWPQGSGYVDKAVKTPDIPHKVRLCSTEVEIIEVNGPQWLFGENSSVEYREGKQLVIYPGAKISYLSDSQQYLSITDYNGDKCLLPYGITVEIDEFGKFIPISYHPKK